MQVQTVSPQRCQPSSAQAAKKIEPSFPVEDKPEGNAFHMFTVLGRKIKLQIEPTKPAIAQENRASFKPVAETTTTATAPMTLPVEPEKPIEVGATTPSQQEMAQVPSVEPERIGCRAWFSGRRPKKAADSPVVTESAPEESAEVCKTGAEEGALEAQASHTEAQEKAVDGTTTTLTSPEVAETATILVETASGIVGAQRAENVAELA